MTSQFKITNFNLPENPKIPEEEISPRTETVLPKPDVSPEKPSEKIVSKVPEEISVSDDPMDIEPKSDEIVPVTIKVSPPKSSVSEARSADTYSYSSFDIISNNESEVQSRNVSRDAMDGK